MNILLWTDNLLTRSNLAGTWQNAGATLLKKDSGETPELIVMDLTARDAIEHIRRLRGQYPEAEILAFGPHVDGEAFRQARAAGATSQVARGAVVERVLAKLSA